MKYKLRRGSNSETHAFGDVIYIVDENGNELNVGFSSEEAAFDYIKTQIEKDSKYNDCINNPKRHIMSLYNGLDDSDKEAIDKSLVQKYRRECMFQYFF